MLFRSDWNDIRAGWAAEGHLTDPEMAAALKAFQWLAAETLRLTPRQFRIGGKAI